MDIYRFIDSRDMREHLQKLNYAFTPPEAAFLVYRCKAATLEEMRLQEQQPALEQQQGPEQPGQQEQWTLTVTDWKS